MSGRAARIFSMRAEIAFGRMAAVHRLQDAVDPTAPGGGDRASAVDLAMRRDQLVGHVGGMVVV